MAQQGTQGGQGGQAAEIARGVAQGVAQGVARTGQARAEFMAKTAQRGELRDQLRELGRRRNQILEQSYVAKDAGSKAELLTRIKEIDLRTARIDAQLQTLDDEIANLTGKVSAEDALANLPSVPAVAPVPKVIQIPQFDFGSGFPGRSRDIEKMMIGGLVTEAVVFVLVGVLMWRVGVRRLKEHITQQLAGNAQRMEQVQQSLDVIGVEVERISEGQRYVAKVLKEGAQPVPEERRLG